ncbi:transposase [Bradyrhizobium sp. USDA 4509]
MFRLGGDLQVYLHREPIDFRAGINSLAVLVQETMALDRKRSSEAHLIGA